ncbi:4-nitrophenylphosphatase [Caerostris extrusa]|uniref:4-nitrophenylphosphatase n=1 Tax=Caerostris extrusa TaxID=172846 RepID=A0AAV4Y7L1_CAEEX|nr:4-nitrophenylphosphatase [Caerostris extrusa]
MPLRICKELNETVVSSGFFDSIDYVLTDCDGVLWMGNEAIPGVADAVHALKKWGKHIIYVTNNSTKSRDEYLKKCETLGYPATMEDLISTSYCAALYLHSLNFKKKVYVLGSSGITSELDKFNISHLPIGVSYTF